ncbi:hypothetical protein IFT48_00195 [Pseudomonas fluorescens]|uniref:hypothetical protein n=1 Tax=Pseudomonas fluorescens TaxID=294 RepID=UPI001930C1EB|nr:hypothetical protein [Pseudomonas fluorescens]MBD8088412.1 hypothetical protein [Pseudomonas fluorescens]
MKYLAMMLALVCCGANAAQSDPSVASQSAYIQLMSVIDGTQSDIALPSISDLSHEIWEMAEQGAPELSSAWIDAGLTESSLLAQVSCIDSPQDFSIEDRGQIWFYRDTRELYCEAAGQGFTLMVEVGIRQERGVSWEYTHLQSINSIK